MKLAKTRDPYEIYAVSIVVVKPEATNLGFTFE